MPQTLPYLAAAIIFAVSAQVDPASMAYAEALLTRPGATNTATADSSVPSGACLRLGACANKTLHTTAPAISEEYRDGLQWDHEWVSLKFSGNRVRFRLHF